MSVVQVHSPPFLFSSMQKYKKTLFFIILFICGCSYISYVKDPFIDIPNFHKVNDSLYRGGQPTKKGLKKLKSLGIKTVVSLKGRNKATQEEQKTLLTMGMQYYNIPLSVYAQPDDKDVIQLLEIVLKKSNQPVFVHCESGRDRTGAMIALYRVVVEGYSIKEAYKEAKRLGFWPYRGKAELKKFIHQIKDKKIYFDKAKEIIDGQK